MSDSPTTELIVVRHGETVWNAEGRQQGHLDRELNDTGRRQAQAIADRLAREQFDALYSSDLARAVQTAQYIARKTGHKIMTDPRLRERHLGIFQGLTLSEAQQQYPEVFANFNAGDPDYVIPGGESSRQRHDRTVGCAAEIAARHAGGRVVIVAHGGVLNGLLQHALVIPLEAPRRYRLFNASFNTFFVQDGNWQLGTWGDVSHLATVGTIDDW